jgi:ABC-type multidrug transport system fused ATPase/permease subunit
MKNLIELRFFLNYSDYKKIFYYLILIFILSLLEVLSIGIIFPIISLILDKNFLNQYLIVTEIILFLKPFYFLSSSDEFHLIANFLLAFVLVIFAKSLITIYINFYRSNFVFIILSQLRLRIMTRFTKIPLEKSLKIKSTDLITFVSQLGGVVAILENIMIMSLEFAIIFSLAFFLFFFDTQASFFLVISICVLSFFLVFIIRGKILVFGETRRKAESDLLFLTNNFIVGIKEIKLSGYVDHYLNNFDLLVKKALKSNRNFNFFSQLPRPYLEFLVTLLIAIFLFINLIKYSEVNNYVISSSAVFLAAGIRSLPSIGKLINSYNSYKYYTPTLNKIYNFSAELEKIKEDSPIYMECKNKISLRKINFSYDHKEYILKNCSFDINTGDKIGLVGASGSGKTTLINLICGLLRPESGEISIDNVQRKNFIISNLSIVTQNPLFINDSIKENLTFATSKISKNNSKILEVLDSLKLTSVIEGLARGIDTKIGERGSAFSGGQLQRLNIARAVLQNPDILILDEATNALDKNTEKKVLDYVFKLYKDKTIIMISHDKKALYQCNKIVTIKNNILEKIDV